MNGYIINPMWFYWIYVSDGIKCAFGLIAAFFFIMSIIFCFDYEIDAKAQKQNNNRLKLSLTLTLLSIVICVLIPSRTVLIEMQIARMATYENVQISVETIKEIVDYIVEAVKTI